MNFLHRLSLTLDLIASFMQQAAPRLAYCLPKYLSNYASYKRMLFSCPDPGPYAANR